MDAEDVRKKLRNSCMRLQGEHRQTDKMAVTYMPA